MKTETGVGQYGRGGGGGVGVGVGGRGGFLNAQLTTIRAGCSPGFEAVDPFELSIRFNSNKEALMNMTQPIDGTSQKLHLVGGAALLILGSGAAGASASASAWAS